MIHKIHAGEDLPSVKAGGSYTIGNSDWSTVAFPRIAALRIVPRSEGGSGTGRGLDEEPDPRGVRELPRRLNFATGKGH